MEAGEKGGGSRARRDAGRMRPWEARPLPAHVKAEAVEWPPSWEGHKNAAYQLKPGFATLAAIGITWPDLNNYDAWFPLLEILI